FNQRPILRRSRLPSSRIAQSRGIAHDRTIMGRVDGVQIHEPTLPKDQETKGKRGRPPGRRYSDDEIVKQAVAAIQSGTMDQRQAVARFASQLKDGASLNAKKVRLRARLKELGIWKNK
ncbi:MAG: hypothetical protein ABJA20_09295, partial [Novosphingobium sp.]